MGYNYVPRMTDVGMRTSPYYSSVPSQWSSIQPLNNYIGNQDHKGNCTSYCIGRWLEICSGDVTKMQGLLSTKFTGTWNGGAWYVCSPSLQAGNGPPQLGDICCWSKGYDSFSGHVAVVEELHTDYVVMSQSEYNGAYFHATNNYAKYNYMGAYYRNRGYVLRGFIRMSNIPSPPSIPSYNMPTEWVHYPSYLSMTEEDRQNNAIMVAVQLLAAGWTFDAIIGLLGNLEAESNLDPQATGTGGGGLAGWTPLTIYKIWSDYYGYTWYDGEKQVEFLTLNAYVDPNDPYNPDNTPKLKPQWQARPSLGINISFNTYTSMNGTPEEMARYWMLCWERPLDQSPTAQAARGARARKYYDFLMGLSLPYWTFPLNQPYKDGLSVWQMAGNAKPKLIY